MLKQLNEYRRQATDYLKRVVTQPSDELTRWQQLLRFNYELGRHCAHELIHDRAGQMAAALTYHTLLSLPPMIIVMMAVFFNFKGMEQYRDMFKNTVTNTILPQANVFDPDLITDPATTQPSEENGSNTEKEMGDSSSVHSQTQPSADSSTPESGNDHDSIESMALDEKQTPATTQEAVTGSDETQEQIAARIQESYNAGMRQNIDELFNQFEKVSFEAIGIIGFLFFIWGSTGLLATIERSFNNVYNVRQSRPWYLRMTYYYTVITLGPAAIIGGILLQQWFISVLTSGELTAWLAGPMILLSPLTTAWFVLFLIYELLPNTRVNVRAALIGSLIAAIGWVIGKEGFALYLQHSTGMNRIYGTLALFPLTLLWIWINWLIVLFGLEIAYALQTLGSRDVRNLSHKQNEDIWVDIGWSVPVAVHIAAAFVNGETRNVEELTNRMRLPRHILVSLLKCLDEQNIINRLDSTDDTYALARPADQMTVGDVLHAAKSILPYSTKLVEDDPAWKFLADLDKQNRDMIEGTLISDLSKYAIKLEPDSQERLIQSSGSIAHA